MIDYIAEISANHMGSLERARKLIQAAAKSGATSVKLQTYTADTMTLNLPQFSVTKEHELWGGKNLYKLYEEAYTPWEWHEELFGLATNLGMQAFSTPFDLTAVHFLESLNVPKYKIASLETGDHALIKAVAETGKPVIVSTGATEWDEISDVVDIMRSTGNKNLTLLVCTSSYPAFPKDSHINRIKTLQKAFGCEVGLSDHTLGIGASIAAIVLGATVIEKHLTLRRTDGGADGAFSMEPNELSTLITEGNAAALALGDGEWKENESEAESRRLRRSLYVVSVAKKGETVTLENVRAIPPGGGAHPQNLNSIIGKKYLRDVEPGTPISREVVEF